MKILIIGGVAGGMSAAARLRRLSEEAEIIVFEKGEYVSFANCGLPYYIGGTIKQRQELLLQTPEGFNSRFNVEVRINSEITAINRDKKILTVKEPLTGRVYEESYDKLILSPGAEPLRPPIPGIEDERIFTLRNIPDTDKIKKYLDTQNPSRGIVIGGGYIGLEMAENLRHRGMEVTLVEALPQVLNLVDQEMAAIIHRHLREKGVNLVLGDKVTAFKTKGDKLEVILEKGASLEGGIVLLAIGVRPDSGLAKACGLEVGERGGIKINTFLQSSDENIYAVGDAVEVVNPLLGTTGPVPLAGPANKQGRIAADNIILGNQKSYRGTIGTSVLKLFDYTAAMTGNNEKVLKGMNINYKAVYLHPGSHAGYYPGAEALHLKLLFEDPSGKILGAQIIGQEGVEKRIDAIAAFMQKESTVYDLTEYEHCYAPPYSSAKDPVNMAGFVGENILSGKMDIVTLDDLPGLKEESSFLLDVRTREEFEAGTIPGAVNIPVDELRERLEEIPGNKKLIIFCQVGIRGYIACRILKGKGFNEVANLTGGYATYDLARS